MITTPITKLERSAIYLAVVLLFGLLCVQALLYFIGVPWERKFTVVLYCFSSIWLVILLAVQSRRWWAPCLLDWLVLLFWCGVAVSIIYRLELTKDATRYLLYAPFMAVLPYLCGRLIPVRSWHRLMHAMLALGSIIALLILADRFYLAPHNTMLVRWPIFGYDHGRLLVGSLFAAGLPFACISCLTNENQINSKSRVSYLTTHTHTILFTVMLVWILARGWLIAGLFGAVVVVLSTKAVGMFRRICLITVIGVTVAISHVTFLKYDSNYGHFVSTTYSETDFKYDVANATVRREGGSILAGDSCRALRGGDSISVRELLYREAFAMFMTTPLIGVGATKFGHYSCWAAANSYPHSTILQVFAELGLLGGGLFVTLLTLALITLLRLAVVANSTHIAQSTTGALALFCVFSVADQFYGNYFMVTGTWLMIGVAASWSNCSTRLRHNDKELASNERE
jgi:hypothetical protein